MHHEVERSYAIGPDDGLPDLRGLPGVARVDAPRHSELEATYVDTKDLTLLGAGVSLRRRVGGDDEGWHLKVPAEGGRDEVHRPLGRNEQVPPSLAALVLGWTRGRTLGAVAVVRTRRTTTLLRDGVGAVLAEVADDVVIGTPAEGGPVTGWREVEIELVEAGTDFLDAADQLLAAAGIEPRAQQRKIATSATDPHPVCG